VAFDHWVANVDHIQLWFAICTKWNWTIQNSARPRNV